MTNKPTHKLLRYSRPYFGGLALLLLFSLIAVICQLIIPIHIGHAVNSLVGEGQVDWTCLKQEVAFIFLFALSAGIVIYFQNSLAARLSYQITHKLRKEAFIKIHKLPLAYLDSHPSGDIVSRIINDIDLLASGLLQSLTSLFSGIATIIGIVLVMVSLNWKVGLLVIILTPVSLLVSSIIANRTYRYFQEQVRIRGELGAYIDEMANNQYLIKSFSYQGASQDAFDEINQRLHKSGVISQFSGALINPTSRLINSLVYALVGLYGAFTVLSGQLSVGLFVSFLTYASQYTQPFNEISAVINEMQTALASAQRVFEFLEQKDRQPSNGSHTLPHVEGNITLQHLYFSYQKDHPLIEDLSLEVSSGQTVAIVGPTGAGKTTLINLLMRFYDPQKGKITIDGIDTQTMHREDLRQLFGMVLQDSWIFRGSVADNIAYGNPSASREEIIEAAKKASVHRLIEKLPEGYDTLLEEEGSNLSTGQKQLICIARIILANPKMLILDEATSSIDTLTEKMVQASFDRLMKGRTTFVVAHRLSTIEQASVILVMDHGRVVEQGRHKDLLAQKGFYYRLYTSQFEH